MSSLVTDTVAQSSICSACYGVADIAAVIIGSVFISGSTNQLSVGESPTSFGTVTESITSFSFGTDGVISPTLTPLPSKILNMQTLIISGTTL